MKGRSSEKSLIDNTIFMYILTFSNYVFGFITTPYLTRVLGVEAYGIVGWAFGFYTYFTLVFDFGFILSATRDISNNHGDKERISKIMTAVTLSKVFLVVVSGVLFFSVGAFVDMIRKNFGILFLYYLYAAFTAFCPDFVYRGIEKMRAISIRTVLIKAFATVLTFLIVKDEGDIMYVPLCLLVGSVAAVGFMYFDLKKSYGISLVRVELAEVIASLKASSQYFISRIASTFYSTINTIIIGFFYPVGAVMGLYSSANKIYSLASQAYSPIADSLYPYMLKTRNFGIIKKAIMIFMPLITIACVILWCFAGPICELLFGAEFLAAADYVRWMVPLIFMQFPIYVLGFPTLGPLGKERWANYSVEIAAVLQILMLVVLYFLEQMTVDGICLITCISNAVLLLIRVLACWRGTREMKP